MVIAVKCKVSISRPHVIWKWRTPYYREVLVYCFNLCDFRKDVFEESFSAKRKKTAFRRLEWFECIISILFRVERRISQTNISFACPRLLTKICVLNNHENWKQMKETTSTQDVGFAYYFQLSVRHCFYALINIFQVCCSCHVFALS